MSGRSGPPDAPVRASIALPHSRLNADRALSPHSEPTCIQRFSSRARSSGSQRDPQVNRCHSIPLDRAEAALDPEVELREDVGAPRAGAGARGKGSAEEARETFRPLRVGEAVAEPPEEAPETFRAQAAVERPPRRVLHGRGRFEGDGLGHGRADPGPSLNRSAPLPLARTPYPRRWR